MKLIATLATLAALVGQTEAATSLIHTHAVTLGNGPCADALVIDLDITAMASTNTLEVQLDGITTDKTVLSDVTTMADWDGGSDGTTYDQDRSGYVTANPLITKDGTKTTWKFTMAGTVTAEKLRFSLKNLCAPDIHDFGGDDIKLKTKMTATAASDASFVDATASALPGTTKLEAFKIIKMPTAKGTEGEFEAEFTGVALTSKKITINLPAGYIVPQGSVCKIGPADGTLTDVTPSGGLAAAGTTNSETFTADATITAVKTKFTCTKVKSGTTWTYDATKNVALKIGSATVPTHAGYATMSTPAPTKSPTKAADSPASVATASGVVVGALGVAALFLA